MNGDLGTTIIPSAEPLSILCVDDEENILYTLKRILRFEPVHVLTATSGPSALEILRTTRNIGLILSDLRMPEMDGIQFLEAAGKLSPFIPRMLLTGYLDIKSAMDAVDKGGCIRFLTKPCPDHDLIHAIREGLCRYRLGRENERLLAELSRTEERLNLAFRATREGVWEWTLETGHVYVSSRCLEMLGYAEDEIEPHLSAWMRLLHPDDRATSSQSVTLALQGAREYEIEFRLQHKSGHYVPILSRGYLVRRDVDLRVIRIVGTYFDLTERKRTEQKLVLARDEAERSTRVKSEFLATMSHEIRTPVNTIIGMSEILKLGMSGPLSCEQQQMIENIEESGRYLLALINDILDLTKAEADMMTVHMAEVCIEDICTASMMFIRERAIARHIKLMTILQSAPPTITTDPLRLKQILVNLLSNAVKFTPEGGEIELKVTACLQEEKVRFMVRDSGIGICPDMQSRLFQPFVRADDNTTRSIEGTGLGLSIVARMTNLLEGTVTLESVPGNGCMFTVTLPYRTQS